MPTRLKAPARLTERMPVAWSYWERVSRGEVCSVFGGTAVLGGGGGAGPGGPIPPCLRFLDAVGERCHLNVPSMGAPCPRRSRNGRAVPPALRADNEIVPPARTVH